MLTCCEKAWRWCALVFASQLKFWQVETGFILLAGQARSIWNLESSRLEVDTSQGIRIRGKYSQVSMGHKTLTLHPPPLQASCLMSGQGGGKSHTGGDWVDGKDRATGIMRSNLSMKERTDIHWWPMTKLIYSFIFTITLYNYHTYLYFTDEKIEHGSYVTT